MPRAFNDLSGQDFGRWVVLRFSHRDERYQPHWWVRCSCGFERTIISANLTRGRSTMCRKCSFVIIGGRNSTHGHTRKGMRPSNTYQAWCSAKGRTLNPRNKHWMLYGGRGIQMCEAWRESFVVFLKDMGDCPEGLTLERVDCNGNYSCGKCSECAGKGWPSNCTWDTQDQQANNTRRCRLITFNGKTQSISRWAKETGLHKGTLHDRLTYCGWSAERALTTPTAIRNRSKRLRVGDMIIRPSFFI